LDGPKKEDGLEKHIIKNQSVSRNKSLHWFKSLGPGLKTGASDDDPSGIATYSQAGAQFSFGLLWLALFQFYPLHWRFTPATSPNPLSGHGKAYLLPLC
jgi:hypothetical protein